MNTQANNLHDFKTKEEFLAAYGNLVTRWQLDWLLRFRHENGLDKAVSQIGRRLVINVPEFVAWLANGGMKNTRQ